MLERWHVRFPGRHIHLLMRQRLHWPHLSNVLALLLPAVSERWPVQGERQLVHLPMRAVLLGRQLPTVHKCMRQPALREWRLVSDNWQRLDLLLLMSAWLFGQ